MYCTILDCLYFCYVHRFINFNSKAYSALVYFVTGVLNKCRVLAVGSALPAGLARIVHLQAGDILDRMLVRSF